MTLTTPRGFTGGPMADIDYGIGAAGGPWVESTSALAVTQPNAGTRTVSIAPGNADAFGIRVTNDAALPQALAAPSSGGAWYMLALRFNWALRSVTLVALPGPTTGSTAAPVTPAIRDNATPQTPAPTVMPATFTSTPGASFDMPLAWAFVNSANTTVSIFDLRVTRLFNGDLYAMSFAAVYALGALQGQPAGSQILCADGATYCSDGVNWQLWSLPGNCLPTAFLFQPDVGADAGPGITAATLRAGILTFNYSVYSSNPRSANGVWGQFYPAFRPKDGTYAQDIANFFDSGYGLCNTAVSSDGYLIQGAIKIGGSGSGGVNAIRGTFVYRIG